MILIYEDIRNFTLIEFNIEKLYQYFSNLFRIKFWIAGIKWKIISYNNSNWESSLWTKQRYNFILYNLFKLLFYFFNDIYMSCFLSTKKLVQKSSKNICITVSEKDSIFLFENNKCYISKSSVTKFFFGKNKDYQYSIAPIESENFTIVSIYIKY